MTPPHVPDYGPIHTRDLIGYENDGFIIEHIHVTD